MWHAKGRLAQVVCDTTDLHSVILLSQRFWFTCHQGAIVY